MTDLNKIFVFCLTSYMDILNIRDQTDKSMCQLLIQGPTLFQKAT